MARQRAVLGRRPRQAAPTTATMLLISAAALGLIAGSFINALAFRFNTGRSVLAGRSACVHCGRTIGALDLIPVLSYVFLRGKCRHCKSRISLQYPLVEALAALLAYGVYANTGLSGFFVYWFFVWMTVLFIVVYDVKHAVIPWNASLALLALSIGGLFLTPFSWGAVLAGPVLAAPLLFLSLVSRERWMGWGDGFFQLSLGWFLGLVPGLTALTLAIWSGALAGIALVLVSQLPWKYRTVGFTMKSELAFAPFLAFGASLVYFLHVDLFSAYLSLW